MMAHHMKINTTECFAFKILTKSNFEREQSPTWHVDRAMALYRWVSATTAWRVQWTRLPHSPKTDSDHLIKDNRGRYCPVCSLPLPFQRSTDSNSHNCLWLDDHYQSSDCGGVSSIGLPILLMLWCRSPSFMISYQVANLARTQLTGDRMQVT